MVNRFFRLWQYLSGKCVVIYIENDKMIIDKGNNSKNKVYDIAVDFFHRVYTKA